MLPNLSTLTVHDEATTDVKAPINKAAHSRWRALAKHGPDDERRRALRLLAKVQGEKTFLTPEFLRTVHPDIRNALLFDAIADGRALDVGIAIDAGASIDAQDRFGLTPLELYVYTEGCPRGVLAELSRARGFDINARIGILQKTPLHIALELWGEDALELESKTKALFAFRADPNVRSYFGDTALHVYAAELSLAPQEVVDAELLPDAAELSLAPQEVVDAELLTDAVLYTLLDKTDDVNAVNDRGETPLYRMCVFSNREEFNADSVKLFIDACRDRRLPIDLDRGATAAMKHAVGVWSSPLLHAIATSNVALVQVLLDAGAALDKRAPDGDTPLHKAVQDESRDAWTRERVGWFDGRKAIADLVDDAAAIVKLIREAEDRRRLSPRQLAGEWED